MVLFTMAMPNLSRMPLIGLCSVVAVCGCVPAKTPVASPSERGRPAVADMEELPGKQRFDTYCAACHRRGGQGAEGRVPPLDSSPWVSGSEERLVRIVLNGLRGPIEIDGQLYNLEMPAFRSLFKDEEIASMLTYVRQQFGSPSSAITQRTVKRVRNETQDRNSYWTVEELLQIP